MARCGLVLLLSLVLCVSHAWGAAARLEPNHLTVQGKLNECTATNVGNAYSCALDKPLPAYVDGVVFTFRASAANTGSATLNVSTLGALTLKTILGGALTNLVADDILAGQYVTCYRESTTCVVTSQLNGQDTRHLTATPQFGSLGLGGAAGATGTAKLYGGTSGSVVLAAPATGSAWTLVFPGTGGTNNYALVTDGSGVTAWVPVALINASNTFTGAQTIFETTSAPGVTINLSGNASPTAPPASGVLWVIGQDTINSSMVYDTYADVGGSSLIFRRAKNTVASPAVVTSGLSLGGLQMLGWDGSVPFAGGGQFRALATETWSSTAHGGLFEWLTVSSTTTTLTSRMRLHDGLMVGTTTDPGAGKIDAANGYLSGGTAGLSVTKTVRASGGAADCTLIYTGGLLTGGSC